MNGVSNNIAEYNIRRKEQNIFNKTLNEIL
jgi:hypothetical protein